MAAKVHVTATINGEPVEFLCEPRQSLLEVLRDELKLTGSKEGCNNGNCGACSVILDGLLVDACIVLGAEIDGCSVETIEGLMDFGGSASATADVSGKRRAAVRHLHAGLHYGRQVPAGKESSSERGRHPSLVCRKPLSLHPAMTRLYVPSWMPNPNWR